MDGAVGLWTCGCWESWLPGRASREKIQIKLIPCNLLCPFLWANWLQHWHGYLGWAELGSLGGIGRFYEVQDWSRTLAPAYLNIGSSNAILFAGPASLDTNLQILMIIVPTLILPWSMLIPGEIYSKLLSWRKDISAHTWKWRGSYRKWGGCHAWKMVKLQASVREDYSISSKLVSVPSSPISHSYLQQWPWEIEKYTEYKPIRLSQPDMCILTGQGKMLLCWMWGFLWEGLPAWSHYGILLWDQESGSSGIHHQLQVLMFPSSCGSPTQCVPRPSQLVSLFLASNEAINELYKSPKLSLELDGW